MSPEAIAPPFVRHLPLIAGLVLLWILLWGDWSWANVLSGLLVAVLVTWLLPLPPVTEHARLRPLRVLAFLGWFLGDLLVSSAQVAWLAIRPGPVRSAVIAVQLRTDSDLLLTLLAETLNLVPGSLVLDVDRRHRRMLVHILVVRDEREIEQQRIGILRTEERIVRAFGSTREVDALKVPVDPRPPRSGS
jgi:multicomponent Na+:H+ antiporter subunit E